MNAAGKMASGAGGLYPSDECGLACGWLWHLPAHRCAESGVPVADLCREHGISNATYYNWRSMYGGMDASLMSEMKAMADENRRLKKRYAEMAMQNELLKDALGKK